MNAAFPVCRAGRSRIRQLAAAPRRRVFRSAPRFTISTPWIERSLGDNFAATAPAAIPAVGTSRQLAAVQTGASPIGSVATLRAQVAAEDAAAEKEAAESLARGRQLLSEGKANLAKTYLQIAARHSKADVRDQALALLRDLDRAEIGRQGRRQMIAHAPSWWASAC